MYKVIIRKNNRERRKLRVRKKVTGTAQKPRMSVFRSNRDIFVQLIDDEKRRTTLSFSSNYLKGKREKTDTKVKKAFEVGKELAEMALKKGIKKAVFDRNGYRYHGRVKSLADGAREGGLVL